ncbi:glutathione S-transferase T3-like [Salvia miltiorrhiza]|uniref:glutathione S-transferase T3-like n=1 Tax=Salvia miltiorrhiza TaxID=226208 RepID=UPI0025AD4BA7|nr:glutathione S-transferase T3-like [Salvia miltiorrhiza]
MLKNWIRETAKDDIEREMIAIADEEDAETAHNRENMFNSQTFTSQPFTSQPFASQIPSHCTQINLTDDDDVVEIPTSTKKSKRKWSVSEEICLAQAWGTISNSSIVGNAQKNKEFWEKTVEYYNAARPKDSEPRKWEAIKSHYYHIMPDVNIFSGWYNNFYENRASGQSDEDVLDATLEKWRSVNPKKEFKYQHVWKIMRDLEKWAPQQMARHASKKAKTSESESHTSTEGMPEVRRRPMGQQRAKKLDKSKGKGKLVEESNNKWEQMLEIKTKEFERADGELMLKEFETIRMDTSGMTDEELHIHSMIVASIKAKRNW